MRTSICVTRAVCASNKICKGEWQPGFIVHELSFEDFVDFKKMDEEIGQSMTKDIQGNPIKSM